MLRDKSITHARFSNGYGAAQQDQILNSAQYSYSNRLLNRCYSVEMSKWKLGKQLVTLDSTNLNHVICDVGDAVVSNDFHNLLGRRSTFGLHGIVCDPAKCIFASKLRYWERITRVHRAKPN